MNIGIFINSFYGGGAERVIYDLVRSSTKDDCKFTIIIIERDGHYIEKFINLDVDIVVLKEKVNFFNLYRYKNELSELIVLKKIDLLNVHLTNNSLAVMRAVFLGLNPKIPVVISEHNNMTVYFKRFSYIKKLYKKLEVKILYRKASHVISVSEGVKTDLIGHTGLVCSEVSVIYNPVDLEKVSQACKEKVKVEGREFRICGAGRLVRQKGFDILIDALSKLEPLDLKLTLLGEGEELYELEKKAKDLNLVSKVEFLGHVSNPWKYIAAADLFVLPSRWEGFGNVIIEAFACATPVIAADCPYGPSEIIIDKQNGCLVPVENVDALTNVIRSLYFDESSRERYVINAKSCLDKYDVSTFSDKYISIYKRLLINEES